MTKESWKNLWVRYRHLVPVLLYMIFYMSIFTYVENRPSYHVHLLASKWDRFIPFCEYFIIPYFLWFAYVAFGVLYFALVEKDRSQYWALIINLGIGMTVFLIVSLVWPNGHTLRPGYIDRDNIFMSMVRSLWRIDTSTNVLPSIHVFNSVAIHIALAKSPALKKHPAVVNGSLILCLLIIASTMFLKQHTVIDVVTALALNFGCYHLVYQPQAARKTAQHSWRIR
ncbi:MAG: phosphatase PAP2 family protein [Eubacteriales bacterium]|nr:phosphatase PAP2 family protein [Eubacteriales bacterium]